MGTTGCAEATEESLVAGVQEQHGQAYAGLALNGLESGAEIVEKRANTNVDPQGNPLNRRPSTRVENVLDDRGGDIVDAEVAEVFERMQGRGLARPGQAADHHDAFRDARG
jgi:hypothetical protein